MDMIIRGAQVLDGTGRPAFEADVGVEEGKLVLNPAGAAKTEFDAAGLTLCPGFIDSHSHADQVLGAPDEVVSLCKISQGVTTEVTGQCGLTPFPVTPEKLPVIRSLLESFTTKGLQGRLVHNTGFGAFLGWADTVPKVGNYAFNCGHATLRAAVLGMENRRPEDSELRRMKELLRESMENGCFGMSSGLIYVPSLFADTAELLELARELRPYGGVYATHMRSEADHVVEAVREAIAVAEGAGVPLVISHHKICGRANWGASAETLRLVHDASARGVPVTLDQYPYEATQTVLNGSIPPRCFAGGIGAMVERLKDPEERQKIRAEMDEKPPRYNSQCYNAGGFERVLIVSSPGLPEARGLTVAEFAAQRGQEPYDAYFDLLIANGGAGLGGFFCLDERDVESIYLDENTVVGSDGIVNDLVEPIHPRAYGTFTRALARFSLQQQLLPLERAVYKQTWLTAQRWGLAGKGRIADGFDADLVLLDPKQLRDEATFRQPRALSAGVARVWVAGVPVYAGGALTGEHPGSCIRRA